MQQLTKQRSEPDTGSLWEPKGVARALSEAYRVLSATERRVGHGRVKAAWPEYKVSFEDEVGQQQHKTYKKTMPTRSRPTAIQIAHMELILLGGNVNGKRMQPWLNGVVRAYPIGREMLVSASMARAHGYSGRQLCEARGWHETTFRRNRDKAAQIIANQLNRAGLLSW